ncbi:MAG: cysteine desulfurase family protein [Ignavibacteria bacterium]
MNKIYLDNAATTKVDERVLDAMIPYYKNNFGNSSSLHSYGKSAKVLLEDARETVADLIGAEPKEIFFTNSGTESNNFALKGLAYSFLASKKTHIITSAIEHLSVLDTINYLKAKFNFRISYIKPDNKGKISPQEISSLIEPETFLISIMHSNNEIGVINNISYIAAIASENNIYMHTDSVQSIGKTSFNVRDLNVNLATLSAHKIYGPKGIAALYIKDKTPVEKFIHGGSQERDMRGGTESIASIAGFKKAVEILNEQMEDDIIHYSELKKYLTHSLITAFNSGLTLNSSYENSLPNIVNVSLEPDKIKFDEEMLLIRLDLKGIAVSGGSACSSGTHQPSHVLIGLGRDRKSALGSLRISFGRDNTFDEIDYLVKCLKEILV